MEAQIASTVNEASGHRGSQGRSSPPGCLGQIQALVRCNHHRAVPLASLPLGARPATELYTVKVMTWYNLMTHAALMVMHLGT